MTTTRLIFSFLILLTILLTGDALARQPQTEPRAAWQVLRYDITATVTGAGGGERSLTGRATISARNVGGGAGREMTVRLNPAAEVTNAKAGDATASVRSRKDERANLLVATLTLPSSVPPGGTTAVTVEYRLPVADNSGIASISPEGAQFLPLSYWYPTPNTPLAPRGADYAPYRLSVGGAGDTVVSAGRASGDGFDQPLNSQPFLITGKFETIAGAGEARGVSAFVHAGASAEERQRAEALVALAAAARAFYAGLLGPAPDTQVRLVGVRRGAGFEMAGTLLLDHAAFRRTKTDSTTALQIAEAVARLWVGGARGLEGEGAGAVREGLPRFLATLFLEQQFGKEVADKERTRMALLYAPIARRDAPLAQTSPIYDTYFNSAANKGALVWRIVMNAVGRDFFNAVLRREFSKDREGSVSLASLRAAFTEGASESFTRLLAGLLEQPTDTDLLVGLPQRRGAGQAVALRNMGSFDVEVTVQATTDGGQRVSAKARVPAKDFGEALFQTTAKIVRVEVDPEKLYPQVDYANDVVPRSPSPEEAVAEARAQLTRGEFAQAESTTRTALARAPLSEDARVVLGRAVLEQNRLDEAEKEFRAALDSTLPGPSTLAWANIGLGEIALRRNRAAEAVKRFNEAARADGEYGATIAARAARIKAEVAASAGPPVDEQVKAAATQLDAAIRSGRKADIESAVVPGELGALIKGIIGTQPEVWQTRVLRTDTLGPNLAEADVSLTVRALGRDTAGTAVLYFARTPAGWKLLDRRYYEER